MRFRSIKLHLRKTGTYYHESKFQNYHGVSETNTRCENENFFENSTISHCTAYGYIQERRRRKFEKNCKIRNCTAECFKRR